MLNSAKIYGFVRGVLQHTFENPQPIPDFHKELWDVATSSDRQVAIAAPRGHAKSTAITLSFVLASALFRDSKYIIIVSDTESQSSEFLGDIKMQLIENEDIHTLFGKPEFVKDSESVIVVRMPDGHQFRIVAKGAGQRIRGRKWRNTRPDLIVVDDLEDDEAVESKERRNKLYRWFTNALVPALSRKNGRIRVVGTVLHMDSVLEKLLNKKAWTSHRYAAHNEDFSEILWPEMFSREDLEAIRDSYLEDGNPAGYSQEYLNYPIDESTAYFRRDDFQAYNPDEVDYDRLSYYSAVDFAITEKESSDYTVIATVGIDERGMMYVVDVNRGRWDAKEIIDRMMDTQHRYDPEIMTVEAGAIQKALGPFLKERMLEDVFINLKEMTPVKDKQSRARSIQARLRQGTVFFNTRADWYADLEQEMVRFPRDKHDDMVDALAWIGLTLANMNLGHTPKEYEDEQWEEEFEDDNDDFFALGGNPIGGY